MVDVGVVSLPSGHQAFRTPSKPVIDIPRSYDTGHSTQFHRSMSTAIRQQSLHRSSQHRLQPTEPQPTRQRSRPVLSQTIGHPRRRLAVGCRVRQRGRTPVLHRDRDGYLKQRESPVVYGGRESRHSTTRTIGYSPAGVSKSSVAWINIPSHVRPCSFFTRLMRSYCSSSGTSMLT